MEDEKVREEETTRKVMYTVNDTRQEVEQIQYKNYIVRVCDYLDDIPTHEMGDEIKYLDEDIRNLQLENTILEGFLKEHEPGLLAGLQSFLDSKERRYNMPVRGSFLSMVSSGMSKSRSSVSSIGLTTQPKGKLNLSTLSDLLFRAFEVMHRDLEKFINHSHVQHNHLTAEIENIRICQAEVDDATALFEQQVVVEGTDPITNKVPAEKFIKYMNNWIKSVQCSIDKVRLRFGTSKSRFIKICQVVEAKEEQREGIREVDFEKLMIENKRLALKVEQKNQHLIELKTMTGGANCVLMDYKNFLHNQLEELKVLDKQVKACTKKTLILDAEYEKVISQVDRETRKLKRLKNLIKLYNAPSVLTYATLKEELYNVTRNDKIMKEKLNIQKMSLSTYYYKSSHLLGRKHARYLLDMMKKGIDIATINEWIFNLPCTPVNTDSSSESLVSRSRSNIHNKI